MSEQRSSVGSGGVGLGGLVFVVFLIMKLMEIAPVAAWSWWWVTVPLWGGVALLLAIMAVGGVIVGGVFGVKAIMDGMGSNRNLKRQYKDLDNGRG